MWVMPVQLLVDLEILEPHEVQMSKEKILRIESMQHRSSYRGDLRGIDRGHQLVIFVSHQWVAVSHPDPKGLQLAVLQQALRSLAQNTLTIEVAC